MLATLGARSRAQLAPTEENARSRAQLAPTEENLRLSPSPTRLLTFNQFKLMRGLF